MPRRNKHTFCKYCGAQLKRDPIGQYCPTHNCQWEHGLPTSEDTPTRPILRTKPK
jgi:hypothetical protein